MGYFRDTVKGVSWVGGFRFVTRLVSFGRIAILARIFSPFQLGLVGIATLVLAFVEMITETGINVFLIQERDGIEKYLRTAWVVSIARGVIIAFAIALAAPFVAQFFKSPDAYSLLLLISVVPIIRGFVNPAIVKFQTELTFDREFWFKLAIFVIETITTLILALTTRDAASLVWGFIAGAASEVVLSFILIKPRPSFAFEFGLLKRVLNRGKWVTAYGIANYAFEHLDDAVVGRLLGISPLGLYQTAYKISSLPITEITGVVGRVTFPIYTRIVDEPQRLKKAFLNTTTAVSALTLVPGLFFFFFPKEIIQIVLGSSWIEAAPALRILVIFGVVRAIFHSMFILFLSVKKQEFVTISTFVSTFVLALSVVPLVSTLGIVGASFAALVAQLSVVPLIVFFTWKILKRV